jgi:hypothetical protein
MGGVYASSEFSTNPQRERPNYVLQRTPGTFLVSSKLRGPAPLNTALGCKMLTQTSTPLPRWQIGLASIPLQLIAIFPVFVLVRSAWAYLLVLVPLCGAIDYVVVRFYTHQVLVRRRAHGKVIGAIAWAGIACFVAFCGLLFAVSASASERYAPCPLQPNYVLKPTAGTKFVSTRLSQSSGGLARC